MYIVKYDFVDLQDDNYAYKAGETYPREGYTPNEARINELITEANAQGRELIMMTKDPVKKTEDKEVEKTPAKTVTTQAPVTPPAKTAEPSK